ncbi:MAG: isoleucine--tRNA ligase [Gemmatimonadetes bacterium]|nr:MAG: isoleucine--tRNA ligase [Gemmatimonadota bacterium]
MHPRDAGAGGARDDHRDGRPSGATTHRARARSTGATVTVSDVTQRFTPVPADQPADELEQALLARWRDEDLFARTLAARAGAEPFVFFEGPPTANGKPGIHHVFARTIKDLFCRHRAMKGYLVHRKAGWDTHGLPVEIEVEKRLGISGKQDIEKLGVAEFNRLCRESVFTYRGDWERLSERIGYWLDYEDPYVTYTPEYVESVWWALATLYRKGLLYRGHKILPYCARCGTALSSHEVAQGYEDVDDPSVYVALDLGSVSGEVVPDADGMPGRTERRILVWTTTPWTLVSNTALAVHPELEYVELRKTDSPDTRTIILAAARAGAVLGEDYATRWTQVRTLTGEELVGARYRRPIDWLPYPEGTNHEIVVGERFVSADDGSGVVHMAPAFGADDYAAGKRHNLAFLQPVNPRGEFPEDLPLVGGQFVKHADPALIEELKRRGVLWKAGTMTHSYPHCWRCGTPLLYYARTSWFVRTSSYKDEMLSRNARVGWHPPQVGSGRFGEWLENNIDWAISRDRYWGTPLPVWVCDRSADHLDVLGSYAELAERTGASLAADFDPHKPNVDEYRWACTVEGCGGAMYRTPEVIDTWFDSGSMPFAQWHYPFEHRDALATRYPGDFIAEGLDQTRGWFYSLLARRRERPRARRRRTQDVEEPRQRGRPVGGVLAPWRGRGAALPRQQQQGVGATLVRREPDPPGRGALPADAQAHLQRDVRPIRELRLVALGGRPGAGRAATAGPMDPVAAGDGGARGGRGAPGLRRDRRRADAAGVRGRGRRELVRASIEEAVLRRRQCGQPRRVRDAARGAGRRLPVARAVRAIRDRLAASGADGRVGASRAVRSRPRRAVRCIARGADGEHPYTRDARPRGARAGGDQRAAAALAARVRGAEHERGDAGAAAADPRLGAEREARRARDERGRARDARGESQLPCTRQEVRQADAARGRGGVELHQRAPAAVRTG